MSSENNKKISVIIPAFNVEEYIGKCLESVINQSYKNIEIIVVNDGSTDNTLQVINEYANKENRIKVINQENQGVSVARNRAIDIVIGDYLIFFDADDIVPEKSLEILLNECLETDAEISISNMLKIKNGKIVGKLKEIKKVYSKIEALNELFIEEYINCSVGNKLYKIEAIKNERYNENLKIAEDFEFLYRIIKNSNKIAVNTEEVVYHYLVRENSAMQGGFDSRFEKEIPLCEEIIEEVRENYPEIIDSAIRRYQRAIVSCLSKCLKETGNTKQVDYLFDKLKKYPLKLKGYNKIRVYLLYYFKPGLKFIYNVYSKL